MSNERVIGFWIPIAAFICFIFVSITKSNNKRFILLTIASLLFILEILLFNISFYDYIPLIYLILFINAFMLSNPLINLMYAFLYLLTIYQFEGTLPKELLIGNMIGILINSFIYTALAILVIKFKKDHEIIKEKELKYRTLFNCSGDIVYLFELTEDNMPGEILEINNSACQKFGYHKNEILHMNPLQFTAHDRLSKIKEVQEKLIKSGTITFEGKYISKNGQYIPSEITATVFNLGDKKVVLAIARDITERKRLEEKLHYLAYHDSLTGLPNRDLLKSYIRNIKHGSRVAFLFVDLDGFKTINDTFGHDYGDQVIQLASSKLTNCIVSKGMVTRFGGDEFLLLLENVSYQDVKQTAEAIIQAFLIPFDLGKQDAFVTVSIGISFSIIGEKNIDAAIKEADIAMYLAKENGKNNYHFFEKSTILVEKRF